MYISKWKEARRGGGGGDGGAGAGVLWGLGRLVSGRRKQVARVDFPAWNAWNAVWTAVGGVDG